MYAPHATLSHAQGHEAVLACKSPPLPVEIIVPSTGHYGVGFHQGANRHFRNSNPRCLAGWHLQRTERHEIDTR